MGCKSKCVVGLALAVAACGGDGVGTPDPINPPASIKIATGATLGADYLVDGGGRTLYLFAYDVPAGDGKAAVSRCVADPDPAKSCVAFWPVFHAQSPVVSGIDPADVGEITRPDDLKQTTYKGFPLYLFAGDANPGDINGDASTGGGPTPVWFVIRQPTYTVMTLTDADGTTRLTDGAGRTLYYFNLDTVGDPATSSCAGTAGDRTSCVGNWPLFSVDSIVVPTGLNKARFNVVTRADNQKQLAFDGHPLYYFADDVAPGDQLGLTFPPGLGHWFTLDPTRPTAPNLRLAAKNGVPFTGAYLVDGNANTLYYFAKDVPGDATRLAVSNCRADADPTKSCLAFWPVFHIDNLVSQGFNATDVGEIMRPDGLEQTTYHGLPLYYFAGDTRHGDTNGEASTGGGPSKVWFVLRQPAYDVMVLSKTSETADYLVDGAGRSLYYFFDDTVGTATTPPVSMCTTDPCATNWPFFEGSGTVTVPSLLDPASFTIFTRTDGKRQSAYRGHPLYYYVGDTAPGQTNGRGLFNLWDTIDPAHLP